jgi:hypothetical protein
MVTRASERINLHPHDGKTQEKLWFLSDDFKKYNDAREHHRCKAFAQRHRRRRCISLATPLTR